MASFSINKAARTPFGKNAYLRSTQDVKTESFTCSSAAFPNNVTIDGVPHKVLQPGTVIAKITSGANSGKVGVFDAAATDGRQTGANIVGIADTFVPWQLEERDVDIAVVYEATVVGAWCLHHATNLQAAMNPTTKTAVQAAVPTILFK